MPKEAVQGDVTEHLAIWLPPGGGKDGGDFVTFHADGSVTEGPRFDPKLWSLVQRHFEGKLKIVATRGVTADGQ